MKIKLTGIASSRRVWLNGKELNPKRSQKIQNHSPDGFNWGYGGSGPAQLALAICIELYCEPGSPKVVTPFQHQYVKFDVVSKLPMGKDFNVEVDIYPTMDAKVKEKSAHLNTGDPGL